MEKDRLKWNEKYLKETYPDEPAGTVKEYYHLAPKGRALDIGAGNGRNALFLAKQGVDVIAVDISDVAMAGLAGVHPRLHPLCQDLDTFEIPKECFSLIVNIRFLNRRLFPQIREGLIPGGLLIFESFIKTPEKKISGPLCPDHLLLENELLHAFLSLKILFYQEKKHHSCKESAYIASLVARKNRS
ncbi:MAG: class I SAM-dependent methyltransferase [Proteobacteria bacterium]|nr:class I SAM-dependent methyltransferase [Pseudomonadota bacterium]